MTTLNNRKVLFIINPAAGAKHKSDILDVLIQKNVSSAIDFRHYTLSGDSDSEEITKLINNYSPDVVAAVGGDGTCNYVAQLLLNTNISMGIVPYGSANGMATELNIPKDIEAAIENAYNGRLKKIDMLFVNDKHLAIHLSDVGLNAKIIKRFSMDSKRGIWRYVLHFFKEYFFTRHYRFLVQCEGRIFKRKAISITFANASKYGTGAMINPKGIIDDGLFELCIIKPFPWYYLLPITIKFFKGNLAESKYVEIISCREAKITCNKKLVLQIDGEIKESTKEVSVKIIPQCLNIVVPRPSAL